MSSEVKVKIMNHKKPDSLHRNLEFPGYPSYPENEDIYNTDRRASELNPDDNSLIKTEKPGKWNEKDFDEVVNGDDLDLPNIELDMHDGRLGIEDEENDYFSLGGDNHDDLEEDRLEYPRF